MVALSLQTLLLMGAAYFIGAALACVLRRSLFAPSYQPAERRVDPLPGVETSSGAARFGPGATRASAPSPMPQPVAKAVPPPPSGTHDLKRIRLGRRSTEEWEETLISMLNEGAPLSEEQFPVIHDYLSKHFNVE